MITLFREIRAFVRSVKALARYWCILLSHLACFSWNRKLKRIRAHHVVQHVNKAFRLIDELGFTRNTYWRKRVCCDLLDAYSVVQAAKAGSGYPRMQQHGKFRQAVALMDLRYYAQEEKQLQRCRGLHN